MQNLYKEVIAPDIHMVEKSNIKEILRIASVDLDGYKPVVYALHAIKGVSFSFSNALCRLLNIPPETITGALTETQIQQINGALKDPLSIKMPKFMLNRRKDNNTGENKHFITNELDLTTMNDIGRLKKIKSYRGFRHAFHLPSRGQRTKAHFRSGKSIGVSRKRK